jgi:hypothetical protein
MGVVSAQREVLRFTGIVPFKSQKSPPRRVVGCAVVLISYTLHPFLFRAFYDASAVRNAGNGQGQRKRRFCALSTKHTQDNSNSSTLKQSPVLYHPGHSQDVMAFSRLWFERESH